MGALPRIERPLVLLACLMVLAVMIVLFVFGESLQNPIAPPAAAIIGSALLLLIAFATGLDSVGDILRGVDWETWLFLRVYVRAGGCAREDRRHRRAGERDG
jgi:Na+/H+ antiporter NhaD/arsenite permease-like protein